MSASKTLLSIFTEPGKAMAAVEQRSMLWLPLLLLVLGNVALMAWYYGVVDFAWLQDRLLSSNPEIDGAAREAAQQFMTRPVMMGGALVGVVIGVPAMLCLFAVYYFLAAKVVGNELSFGKWFAFVVWTSVPTLLNLPAMAIGILMSGNGQIAPEALNPLTLNQLLFQFPMGHPWQALLDSIALTTLWSIAVAVIGFEVWTRRSQATALAVVLLPYVVIYGGWAVYAALQSGAA